MSDVTERVASMLRERLEEIDRERGQLEQALTRLGAGAIRAATPARRRSRGGSGRRAPRGRRREQVLDQIRAQPGAPIADLAKAIGVAPQQLYPIVHRLLASGAIVKRDRGFAIAGKAKSSG